MKKTSNILGKTLTIFLIVISVIFLCLTGISSFFYYKESELRTQMEGKLQETTQTKSALQDQIKENQKQVFLLEEKLKEADEKINSLMDDLELEGGLREEMKKENQSLKEALSHEGQQKEKLEKTRVELEARLKKSAQEQSDLASRVQALSDRSQGLEQENLRLRDELASASEELSPEEHQDVIQLEKELSAASENIPEGKVLSVDPKHDFVVFDLGRRHGIAEGLILSVYHGDKFLGNVRVSKTQDDMSAADIIPPLSIRKIRENDRVVVQQ